MRVLLAEPSLPLANAFKRFLEPPAEVTVARFLDEAVQRFHDEAPEVVVASVSSSFEGEVLCIRLKREAPAVSVVLVYPPEDLHEAPRRAAEAGADGFLVGPLKKHVVLSTVRGAHRLSLAASRARKAEGELALARAELADQQEKLESTLAQQLKVGAKATDEAFFKKYMLLELKRSKRYRYPVSLLLVAIDRLETFLAQQAEPEAQRSLVQREALEASLSLVRDIDIAMPFGEDKLLVFLPHTPRAGAKAAAERVVERLARLGTYPGGTASVGVACFEPLAGEPKTQVSFAALVREANEALRRAFGLGGNRAELATAPLRSDKKRSRIVMG